MRITRYVNGKRVIDFFENRPQVDNEIVASTIEKVNRRLSGGINQNGEKRR